MRLLLHWVLSAVAVWIVANFVPGISVSGPTAALIAALVIGLINATLGLVLKILTFPLTLLTLGIFWFVINALMLELDGQYPGYGFASHKGYPTPQHCELLKKLGATPIHRRSFARVRQALGLEPIQEELFIPPEAVATQDKSLV